MLHNKANSILNKIDGILSEGKSNGDIKASTKDQKILDKMFKDVQKMANLTNKIDDDNLPAIEEVQNALQELASAIDDIEEKSEFY